MVPNLNVGIVEHINQEKDHIGQTLRGYQSVKLFHEMAAKYKDVRSWYLWDDARMPYVDPRTKNKQFVSLRVLNTFRKPREFHENNYEYLRRLHYYGFATKTDDEVGSRFLPAVIEQPLEATKYSKQQMPYLRQCPGLILEASQYVSTRTCGEITRVWEDFVSVQKDPSLKKVYEERFEAWKKYLDKKGALEEHMITDLFQDDSDVFNPLDFIADSSWNVVTFNYFKKEQIERLKPETKFFILANLIVYQKRILERVKSPETYRVPRSSRGFESLLSEGISFSLRDHLDAPKDKGKYWMQYVDRLYDLWFEETKVKSSVSYEEEESDADDDDDDEKEQEEVEEETDSQK